MDCNLKNYQLEDGIDIKPAETFESRAKWIKYDSISHEEESLWFPNIVPSLQTIYQLVK